MSRMMKISLVRFSGGVFFFLGTNTVWGTHRKSAGSVIDFFLGKSSVFFLISMFQ